jgi:hypothetical protein
MQDTPGQLQNGRALKIEEKTNLIPLPRAYGLVANLM